MRLVISLKRGADAPEDWQDQISWLSGVTVVGTTRRRMQVDVPDASADAVRRFASEWAHVEDVAVRRARAEAALQREESTVDRLVIVYGTMLEGLSTEKLAELRFKGRPVSAEELRSLYVRGTALEDVRAFVHQLIDESNG